MNAAILCVGKLRERFYRDAANEYEKRLQRFLALEEIEMPDLPEPANSSPALEESIRRKEGERLLAKLQTSDYVIALCIGGKQLSSEGFAERIAGWQAKGKQRAVWIIGGSLGLSGDVIRRADEQLSLSAMTFPHQLARVLLLEQIYRACKINANERYHK